jgi:hypothetical protein
VAVAADVASAAPAVLMKGRFTYRAGPGLLTVEAGRIPAKLKKKTLIDDTL